MKVHLEALQRLCFPFAYHFFLRSVGELCKTLKLLKKKHFKAPSNPSKLFYRICLGACCNIDVSTCNYNRYYAVAVVLMPFCCSWASRDKRVCFVPGRRLFRLPLQVTLSTWSLHICTFQDMSDCGLHHRENAEGSNHIAYNFPDTFQSWEEPQKPQAVGKINQTCNYISKPVWGIWSHRNLYDTY